MERNEGKPLVHTMISAFRSHKVTLKFHNFIDLDMRRDHHHHPAQKWIKPHVF